MSPGPVEVPPSVLSVGGLPMIHHRTPEYRKALSEVNEGLKYVFQTKNDILIEYCGIFHNKILTFFLSNNK